MTHRGISRKLDRDPYSDPVDLDDVIAAARRHETRPDKDWH